MRIACVYTVERGVSDEKPLPFAMYVPFGIATVATVLKKAEHDVDLLVYSEESETVEERLRAYVLEKRPEMFCFTAISTQFPFVRKLAKIVRDLDPSIYIVIGGHHPSLASEHTIATAACDAICVGEGDRAVVELARQVQSGEQPTGVPSMWIRQPDGSVEKNPLPNFDQDLDAVPYIDRGMWEPWIKHPGSHPSLLLGRGCPFRCTYCSNHAMQQLTGGRFVRLRSPENVVGEVEEIVARYPNVNSIYLEVETIAHQKEAFPLFDALQKFNARREEAGERKIAFGLNFTVTSTFIRVEERAREFLDMLGRANVRYLNIGLESGSEQLRKEVLRRPRYTNDEFIRFAKLAKEYGIGLHFYVLVGVPGETLEHYRETVRVVRATQPDMVSLSIFYPYVGTDLYTVAVEQGLVPGGELDPTGTREELDTHTERGRAALDMPGFSRRRVRIEYILFWYRCFKGHWPMRKILGHMFQSVMDGSPKTWAAWKFLNDKGIVRGMKRIARVPRRLLLRKGYQAPQEAVSQHRTNEMKAG